MSEAKIKDREWITQGIFSREIIEEPLLQMFKRKFSELAPICRDRIVDSNAEAVCIYHNSSPTDCRFSICPRLDLPLSESVRIERKLTPKRRKNHG